MNLTAHEKANIPDLAINVNQKLPRDWSQANEHLQLGKWAHVMYFAGVIIDDTMGKSLEYRDLMKIDKYCDTWAKFLAQTKLDDWRRESETSQAPIQLSSSERLISRKIDAET